ncbi:PCI-domain-containing protein [Gymnopilus junonius]|uniref:PCI-domain-containing protein n=1 Tax=Gymnopilus junonius TaxID=109634 RepID=A0A9P5TK03_GYMJU|nr:PCI-domain-containing protein [Gymnopilus junonius]
MASTSTLSIPDLLAKADSLLKTDPAQAEVLYKQVLSASSAQKTQGHDEQDHAAALRHQEAAIVKLGELYRDQKYECVGSAEVITQSRAFMSSTAKAKTAKLIQTLLDYFNAIPGSQSVQIKTLTDNIAWAKAEKGYSSSIRSRRPTRIKTIRLRLTLIDTLLTELKRLDDKMILTEVTSSKAAYIAGSGTSQKPRWSLAALTSSRTAANSIYCPPHLQASLDLQSGILHAEDKDYTTAYSYFFEAFENMSAQGDEKALGALKYMLLCKVMLNLPEDVTSLLTIKLALKYANVRDVESMRAIARAHQERNLADFEKALRDYKDELSSDPTIRSHLAALYDTLLEQNLLRIVEPYSVVEIEYVAEAVGQERQALSQMILDKIFYGVLDQGRGCLIVYDQPEADHTYGAAIETLEQVGKVVQSLYAKNARPI